MTNNGIRIAFDYKKPDTAVLVVYKILGGSMFYGCEPSMSVIKTYVGEKAIALYSELSGKNVEEIEKESNDGRYSIKD